MHSTLALAAPCLKTEDKKLFTPSIQLHKNLLQNPAYQVAIPALLELHAGRTFSHNSDEKPLKLEISPPKMRPETFSEVPPEFKMDSIPHTTLLNYHPITAFSVGGELRLCLPQVMNSVLKNYSLQQIEHKINELNIYISRCSNEQAKCLKLIKVLPERVPYCGLITKSNAERLVHELLEKESESIGQSDANKKVTLSSDVSGKLFGFRVYHECFGKCKGTLYPTLFVEPEAKCIECLECKYLFAPNKFVCHAHRGHESIGICHWGFDSANWRSYIQISKDQENSKELDGHLEQMKGKTFDNVQTDSLNTSAMGVVKRKLEPESTEKVLIPPIISTQSNAIGHTTHGATPKKKFPRVDCDSGFGSSPDSNSNRSPTTSPPVLTSASSNAATATTLSSLSTASGLRLATSGVHNSVTTLPAQILAATSQGSQLANVIKNNTDLYSQILTSSTANQNVVSSALQLGANGSVALIAAGLQKQQQNGSLQLPRAHSTPFTLIKSGEKLGGGPAVTGAQLSSSSSPAAQLTTFPSCSSSGSAAPSPVQTVVPHTNTSPSVSSPPTSAATPSVQQQQQQELRRQLIAIETSAGNISPASAAVPSNAAILLQQQLKQQQQPSVIQNSPQNVPGSNPHTQQASPAHIALAAHHSGVPQGSLQQTAAPSVVVPPLPSPRDSGLAPSIVPGIRSVVQAAAPPVTMATDLVSPELRMISQAMEVTIAKMNAHCSPSVKLHLDQLVELLKEQQKQYLKDFALTHQENERLTLELKTKEKEISDAKIAISKVRQDLQQTDIELHNEKTLRLRNQVELAQVLRHQQAIGTYNSVMLQHQQQQQQQKLQQNAILKNDAILAARPCIITSENVAAIATSNCEATRESAITKCEPDWSSLSPASDNSDRETPTGSPPILDTPADIENQSAVSANPEMGLRTPTNGSPNYEPEEDETESTELSISRCENDDENISAEVDMRDENNVTSSDLRDEDSDCTTRATPSPTNSNENSSHLVIVDS